MVVDSYISPNLQQHIENRYYVRVNEQARLERLILDPRFLVQLGDHVGLFSDHGVLHARDVARQILQVLDQVHGVLIPARSSIRLSRMKGYAALLAYFHDIGMCDFSEFGRAMHPEFAAREIFSSNLADIFNTIWQENSGNLAGYLTTLASQGAVNQDPKLILREMLAMSMCHSQRKVSINTINNPHELRQVMLNSLQFDLEVLYLVQKQERLHDRLAQAATGSLPEKMLNEGEQHSARGDQDLQGSQKPGNPDLAGFYQNFRLEAFQWLLSPHPALQALREDVVDTLRALRCADALRQRGTLLTTSGGYEIFVDQRTANAVFGLRLEPDRLFLLEIPDSIAAGEANIASSELDPERNLRISFHRGAFTNPGATEYAASSAARVIHDIQNDVICSFFRPPDEPGLSELKGAESMRIMLEETDDNLSFAELVRDQLIFLDPTMGTRIRVVPSLELASEKERDLYLEALPLNWDLPVRRNLLNKVGGSGHLVEDIDPERAFSEVKVIELEPGQVLLEAGASAAFVYIPFDPGLKVIPQSGQPPFLVQPWMPLGVTGVIRGAARNATIRAEGAVRLLMIPKSIYLKQWHHTHSPESFEETISQLKS